MLVLKEYQQRALDALKEYFAECVRTDDANTAFYSSTLKTFGTGIPYIPVKELPRLPYVCLRIPTGGGKTLVACHSVAVASKDLLQTDYPVVLWLVPSNAIREQTLIALRKRGHPYRQALESTVGTVNVLDIEEALYVKRADMDAGTTIIVSTMQAFRRDDTIGLRVYRDSGYLMDHFSGLPEGVLSKLDQGEGGYVLHSLANVLRIRHPVVIVDEAHNARTSLTFEMLARFEPSCIIEFTATPDRESNPSNVLHTVSAAELKAEEMIKMPIRLQTQSDWKELLSDAIACRKNLEIIANKEQQNSGEYIRPIMLLQAERQRKGVDTLVVESVLETLLKDHNIPREQIAIYTSNTKELPEGDDILEPGCPIRFVITVQALREGWDCPFAYVLCSVAESRSATAIEQILGRVMRLPRAKWKEQEELNMAYAFSASNSFYEVANTLADALVENGFERQEAKDLIIMAPGIPQTIPFDENELFLGTVTVDVPEIPDVSPLSEETSKSVEFDKNKLEMTFSGVMNETERDELQSCFPTKEGKASVERAYRISNSLPVEDKGTPAEKGVKFSVPLLAIKQGELFEEFEETHLLECEFDLSKCDAFLSDSEFTTERPATEFGEIVVTDEGRVKAIPISSMRNQMTLFAVDGNWRVSDLVYWLDHSIPHSAIPPDESGVFLTKLIQTLIDRRGIPLEQLVHNKYRLKQAVTEKIAQLSLTARKSAYQMFLDVDSETPLVVREDVCFSYNPRQYPYGTPYRGRYEFKKHYFKEIGDMNAEEAECAQYIDQLEEVDYWARNLERRRNYSFSLPTATDRFYPDFVAKLIDGRTFVVEYKGEHLWSNDDSTEKRNLGELWAKRSEGKCLFVMPKGKDWKAIDAIVRTTKQ